jgi:hypothetical protein
LPPSGVEKRLRQLHAHDRRAHPCEAGEHARLAQNIFGKQERREGKLKNAGQQRKWVFVFLHIHMELKNGNQVGDKTFAAECTPLKKRREGEKKKYLTLNLPVLIQVKSHARAPP